MRIQIYHLVEGWVLNTVVGSTLADVQVPDGFGARAETPENIHTPTQSYAAIRAQLRLRISERRKEVENGGTTVGAIPLATDDRSKFLLSAAANRAAIDPQYTVDWKAAPEMWVVLDAPMLTFLQNAVFDHVTACFAKEKVLLQQLATTADEDLATFAETVEAFQLS